MPTFPLLTRISDQIVPEIAVLQAFKTGTSAEEDLVVEMKWEQKTDPNGFWRVKSCRL